MKPVEPTDKSLTQPFEQSITDALEQFRGEGYVKKVEIAITSESLPPNHQNLLAFLYDQIALIWWYVHH